MFYVPILMMHVYTLLLYAMITHAAYLPANDKPGFASSRSAFLLSRRGRGHGTYHTCRVICIKPTRKHCRDLASCAHDKVR